MARTCNEKRSSEWDKEGISDDSEGKMEQRKTETEVEDVMQRDMKQKRIGECTWKYRNQWRKVFRAADAV